MSNKFFSFIWPGTGDTFDKSSGCDCNMFESDYFQDLSGDDREKLQTFLETAEVGESIYIAGTLTVREADDFEVDWDVVTIPAAEIREKYYSAKIQQARLQNHLRELKTRDLRTYAFPNAVEFHTFSPGGGSHLCWHCSRNEKYFLHENPYARIFTNAVIAKRSAEKMAA